MKREIPSGWEKETTLIHVSIASLVYFIILGYALLYGTATVDFWGYLAVFIGSAVVFYWIPAGFLREYYLHGVIFRDYTISNPRERTPEEIKECLVQRVVNHFEKVERVLDRRVNTLFLFTGSHLAFDGDERRRLDIDVQPYQDETVLVRVQITPAAFGLRSMIEDLFDDIFGPSNPEHSMMST